MALFASPEETQRALALLFDLQAQDPNKLDGILHKYANPFTSWPLLKEPTETFLAFFDTAEPEEAEPGVQQNINPKLEEMIEEFDRDYAAAQQQRITAETASKKFVAALKENAKKSQVVIAETQAPLAPEQERAPVSPERMQHIISAAVQYPGPPEEKVLVFHALTQFASEQPQRDIKELFGRAVEVTEAANVLSAPEGTIPKEALFSPRAAAVFQQLDAVVNHPEIIPKTTLADMTARWGENFVNSAWFTRLKTDANQMIADQKGAAKIMGKVSSLFSDISTTVFRGPIDQRVITYIETYRLVVSQGIPMTSPAHFGGIAMGYGGQLVRMGGGYVLRAGVKAGIKKAAISGATKLGIEALAGVSTGGVGTLVAIGADFLKGLVGKGISFFKSLIGMGTSRNPEDNLILVVGAGVVLVFFLPIFPLLNIPAFNQSMIDTSIANSAGGGMTGGPVINCQLTPDDPQCTFTACTGDCRWPASGIITQGPRTGTYCSVSTSHASGSAANGIDIASFSGGPVYTPRAGTVVEAYHSCPTNSGHLGDTCGGSPEYAGYGNHVILKTDDGYTLMFGHLESAIGVQTGQHVAAGAQIGWMDQTGNSSGTHLHFGVLAGGNVLDFVPPGNPVLSPSAIDGCVSSTAGCTKVCPTAAVTAGK